MGKSYLIALPFLLLAACVRPQTDDKAKISLTLPSSVIPSNKLSTQSASVLKHVVINVTGPGMNPIVSNLDACSFGVCKESGLSETINLEVVKGEQRLFQIIGVYEDSTTEGMALYYGDSLANLSKDSENVNILLTSLGSTNTYGGGISGRYIDRNESAGFIQGPTGRILIKYQPTGRPAMLISDERIINGWFNAFALSNVSLIYEFENALAPAANKILFGGAMNLNSFPTGSSAIAKVWIPVSKRVRSNNGIVSYEPQEAQQFAIGWFTDPGMESTYTSTKTVITSGGITATTRTVQFGNTSIFLTFSNAIPVESNLLSSSPGDTQYYYMGGTSGSCTAGEYYSCMNLRTAFFDGNGKDGIAGFRGVTQVVPDGSSYSHLALGRLISGTVNYDLKLLPQTQPVFFNEIHAYKFVGTEVDKISFDNNGGDSPTCADIKTGKFGTFADTSTTISGSVVTFDTGVTRLDATSKAVVAVCFGLNGNIFGKPMAIRSSDLSKFDTSHMMPATKLLITELNSRPAYNYCSKFAVEARDVDGNLGSLSALTNIKFNYSGSLTNVYSDPTCNNALPAGNGSLSGASKQFFYLKGLSQNTAGAISLDYVSGNGGVNLTSAPTSNITTGVTNDFPSAIKLLLGHPSPSALQCFPIFYSLVDRNGTELPTFGTPISTASVGGQFGLNGSQAYFNVDGSTNVFRDSACTNEVTFGSQISGWSANYIGKNLVPFFVRVTTSGSHNISSTVPSPGNLCSDGTSFVTCLTPATSITVRDPSTSTPANLKVNVGGVLPMGNSAVTIGNCRPVSVEVYDFNYQPVKLSANLSVNMNISGTGSCASAPALQYYSDSSCSGANQLGNTPVLNIPANDSRALIYVKSSTSITGNCQFGGNVISPAMGDTAVGISFN